MDLLGFLTSNVYRFILASNVAVTLSQKAVPKSHVRRFSRNDVGRGYVVAVTGSSWQVRDVRGNQTQQKTVVLTGVHRGPHQAFYTGVKFVVLAQHPVVLF